MNLYAQHACSFLIFIDSTKFSGHRSGIKIVEGVEISSCTDKKGGAKSVGYVLVMTFGKVIHGSISLAREVGDAGINNTIVDEKFRDNNANDNA
ncbi:MAG: hypothetical protein AB4042_07480 [Leptolyngbyaceae cyanobacterium]